MHALGAWGQGTVPEQRPPATLKLGDPHPAGDAVHFARDVATFLRGKQHVHRSNFYRLSGTAERNKPDGRARRKGSTRC